VCVRVCVCVLLLKQGEMWEIGLNKLWIGFWYLQLDCHFECLGDWFDFFLLVCVLLKQEGISVQPLKLCRFEVS
jgi:hypothetical protein